MLNIYADGPRNVQIKPRRVADAYYYEDTTLTCSATGNPTPTLTFTAVEFFSNKAVSDSLPTNVKGNISITLNKKWIGEMYLLKCTAVNSPITAQGKREPVTVSTDVKFTVVSSKYIA